MALILQSIQYFSKSSIVPGMLRNEYVITPICTPLMRELGLSAHLEPRLANYDLENAKSPTTASALLPINLRLDKLCCFIIL